MTNRISYRRIQWYHFGPSGVTTKGYGPPLWGTPHISEVNRARKVKPGSHEQELGSRAETFSLEVDGDDGAPNSNFSKLPELSETSQSQKLLFGLQVNMDKANSCIMLPGRWYIGCPGPPQLISVLPVYL